MSENQYMSEPDKDPDYLVSELPEDEPERKYPDEDDEDETKPVEVTKLEVAGEKDKRTPEQIYGHPKPAPSNWVDEVYK